ncbi:MAG: hypothetical protein QM813_06090 [Verrucomicrobiota bacterium]
MGVGQNPRGRQRRCRIARADPHGDSADMFAIAFEFDDGLVWSHTARHGKGMTGPDTPLAWCEFFGDAYLRIGYGGRSLIRGGEKQYAGGNVDNLYQAGAGATSPPSTRTSSKEAPPTTPSRSPSRVAWPRSLQEKPPPARRV